MATVYKTVVAGYSNTYYRCMGETVSAGDRVYVRCAGSDTLYSLDEWHPTQAAADEIAAKELEARKARIDDTIAELRRLLPAVAAAHSSAAGRAHAGVAT